MILRQMLSPGPFFVCAVGVILLCLFFSFSIRYNFMLPPNGQRLYFMGIVIVFLRMAIPINFPFTISIYSRNILPKVIGFLFVKIPDTSIMVFDIVLILWIAGTIVQSIRFCSQKRAFHESIKKYCVLEDSSYAYLFEIARHYTRDSINIAVVPFSVSPGITGLLKPTLIVPKNCNFSRNELEYIFAHEISHYKKHDLWMLFLVDVVCCIHWWNPLVYIMKNWFSLFMEVSNDQLIMQFKDERERLEYASLILNVSKLIACPEGANIGNALDFVGKETSNLGIRIKYLSSKESQSCMRRVVHVVQMLLLCILVTFSLFFVIEASSPISKENVDGSFIITEENGYFVKEGKKFELYVDNEYLTTFEIIPEDLENLPIYKETK